MERFDVIVVGAGPAGASAARAASLAGLSTLLLEKQKHPREKRCGGGVSAATLKELDFPLPERVVERRCYGMWGIQNRILTEVRVDRCVSTMVSRSTFDAFLVEKAVEAGVRVAEAEACRGIRTLADCVIVTTEKAEYRASVVIGADGFSSVVARSVRPKWSRRETRFCLVADVPLVRRDDRPHDEEPRGAPLRLHQAGLCMGLPEAGPHLVRHRGRAGQREDPAEGFRLVSAAARGRRRGAAAGAASSR